MKAIILAAGLGTRLKPWTLSHPKALVPVDGIPMLERVIFKLKDAGVTDIVINVHHFSDQIIEFLNSRQYGVNIQVSDESGRLLDTGGGIANAYKILKKMEGECTLIYNVDILSDVNLKDFYKRHLESGGDITLLTSDRESTRKLIFDGVESLCGWHNIVSDSYRPEDFEQRMQEGCYGKTCEVAFSGIYIMNDRALSRLHDRWKSTEEASFPIMDFFLDFSNGLSIKSYRDDSMNILDIGKPAALERAHEFIINHKL